MPICPYCQGKVTLNEKPQGSSLTKDVPKEVRREEKSDFPLKEVLYSCPHCDHILGIGTYFI